MRIIYLVCHESGEYEDWRRFATVAFTTQKVADAEAARRNAIIKVAREKLNKLNDDENDMWEVAEAKIDHFMKKLIKDTRDPSLSRSDVHDVAYNVEPLELHVRY